MNPPRTREAGAQRPPVVVVTGPTASGKTPLSIEIAQRFDAEIINADSMQVFRYMDIGTAKPSLEERSLVPHHLFDVVTPDIEYSAGRYSEEARAVAQTIHEQGKLVVLVGGTGLYIRAVLEGLIETGRADRRLREALEVEHQEAVESGEPTRLHDRLKKLDPRAGAAIHPNDLRRTIRALEIVDSCGKEASKVREEHGGGSNDRYRTLHLAIDPGRDIVNERIDLRCRAMVDGGLLQEVRRLRAMGYTSELRPMQAIGYRHINLVEDGLDTLENAATAMQVDTRRFARRQRTWLRKVDDAVWMDPRDDAAILKMVEAFLADR